MKVIFLDIDGVLQPYNSNKRFVVDRQKLIFELTNKYNIDYSKYNEYDVAAVYYDWDRDAVNRIKIILEETNSKIVISSNWRNKKLPNKMKDLLIIHDLDKDLVGQTRDYYDIDDLDINLNEYSYRTREILDYLKHNKSITDYVVIDDLDLSKDFEENFVQTNNTINEEQVGKCIKILSRKIK